MPRRKRIRDISDLFTDSQSETYDWAVSYGDVISLLLVFFVMMATFSTINTKKFEKVQKALRGETVLDTSVDELEKNIRKVLKERGLEGSVEIETDELGVNISIKDKLLFSSGSAEISREARDIISPLFAAFEKLPQQYRFELEGHTDDVPINNEKFPSNWYLSSYRALALLDMFLLRGFDEERFTVEGFADQQPVYPFRDERGRPLAENRAKNRRVVIKVR